MFAAGDEIQISIVHYAYSHTVIGLSTTIILFVSLFYYYHVSSFGMIKRLGLPGPTPLPVFGNALSLFLDRGEMHKIMDNYIKTYGKVFGMYFLRDPAIVVAEPKLLKEIYVKQFSSFHDRAKGGVDLPEPFASMFVNLDGERWRTMRSIFTPFFTPSQLGHVKKIIKEASETYMSKLQKAAESQETFDIYKWHQGLALEVIVAAAFRTKASTQHDDTLLKLARKALDPSPVTDLAVMLPLIGTSLPKHLFSSSFGLSTNQLEGYAADIIKTRRENKMAMKLKGRRVDILDLMLTKNNNPDTKNVDLSETEVLSQCIMFMLNGFETTSIILALTSYHLAIYPEVQEKLREEADRMCPGDDVDPEAVLHMPYLDGIISETLRLYPPGFMLSRQCTESCTINGVQFKKGMAVLIPVYTLHHSEQYWSEPEVFKPERFMPENKDSIEPFAYMPFGQGPRACIGYRLSLMEMKTVLVKMVKSYYLEKAPELHVPLVVKPKATMAPAEPIYVRVRKRN